MEKSDEPLCSLPWTTIGKSFTLKSISVLLCTSKKFFIIVKALVLVKNHTRGSIAHNTQNKGENDLGENVVYVEMVDEDVKCGNVYKSERSIHSHIQPELATQMTLIGIVKCPVFL